MTNPVTIIMIEDDEGHARLIERNIRRSGVNNEIMPFTTGTEALAFLFGSDGSGSQHTLAQYLDAVNARAVLGEQMKRFHQKYDLLLTPATAIPAFAAGEIAPPRPEGEEDWTWWTPFSFPFNLTQQPAMSVPCGFSEDGMPIGLQLVGPMHRDDLVLRAAHAYQQATEHHLRRPAL